MKHNIKISFLVPTIGNREKELVRLFDSFLRQTSQNFEVIVVVQSNFNSIQKICQEYRDRIAILYVESNEKGLSKARNKGLSYCKGDVIVLSDDDCWYPEDAVEIIRNEFQKKHINVLLTQIYDYKKKQLYKKYSRSEKIIKSEFSLLSKSSIEIAFENNYTKVCFDERLGLGAEFVCGEEVDFLINLYRNGAKMIYIPKISVYHDKKAKGASAKQIKAKGAIYAKNFNFFIGLLVCLKDALLKKENNFCIFFEGYNGYKRIKRDNKTTNC